MLTQLTLFIILENIMRRFQDHKKIKQQNKLSKSRQKFNINALNFFETKKNSPGSVFQIKNGPVGFQSSWESSGPDFKDGLKMLKAYLFVP